MLFWGGRMLSVGFVCVVSEGLGGDGVLFGFSWGVS